MKKRWLNCVTYLIGKPIKDITLEYLEYSYETIINTYNSNRHYHTIDHIEYMLTNLDKYFTNLLKKDDKAKIELAIWFHDLIYDVSYSSGVNELLSAERFKQFGEDFNIDRAIIDEIIVLIMVTRHTQIPLCVSQKVICDLDLLGLQGLDYWTNREKVLAEYTQKFSDEEFLEGRLKFLNWMLDKKTIFHTGLFQKHFEKSARNNLNLEKKYFYG